MDSRVRLPSRVPPRWAARKQGCCGIRMLVVLPARVVIEPPYRKQSHRPPRPTPMKPIRLRSSKWRMGRIGTRTRAATQLNAATTPVTDFLCEGKIVLDVPPDVEQATADFGPPASSGEGYRGPLFLHELGRRRQEHRVDPRLVLDD